MDLPSYPYNPFYRPDGPSPYTSEGLGEIGFQFAPHDLVRLRALWNVEYEWVHIDQQPRAVPPEVSAASATPPGPGWRLSEKTVRTDAVPQAASLPEDAFGLAIIRLLKDSSSGSAQHIGKGYFRVKAPGLAKLAAGTGSWGSPESMGVELSIGATGGEITGIVGGAVALVANVARWTEGPEIQTQYNECYKKQGKACEDCVKDSLGYNVSQVQEAGGSAAFAGSAITAAVICGATLGLGCLVAAVAIAFSAWEMVDAILNEKAALKDCPSGG